MIIISASVKVPTKTCSDIPPGLEQNSMGDTVGFSFKNVSINMFVLAALQLIAQMTHQWEKLALLQGDYPESSSQNKC